MSTHADEFIWRKILGRGTFGKVFKCERISDGFVMACKVIKTETFSSMEMEALITEVQLMRKLSGKHPAFLQMYDWRKDDECYRLFLEICTGGNLREKKTDMEIGEIKVVLEQVTSALAYLHSHKIAHLDLKPSNIAFLKKDEPEIKLLDFGLSFRRKDGLRGGKERIGTYSYMSPEMVNKQGFTEASDMWSLGVIAYELYVRKRFAVTGKKSFDFDLTTSDRIKSMFNKRFTRRVPTEAQDWINKLIVVNSSQRLTAEEALNHEYFGNFFNESMVRRFEAYVNRGNLQLAFHPLMRNFCCGKDDHLKEMLDAMEDVDFEGFKEVWKDLMGEDECGFRRIFESLDANEDGVVCLTDLMDWFAYDYVMNSDERLWELIASIDTEGKGRLSREMCERAIVEDKRKEEIDWNEYFDDGQTHTYEEFALLFRLDSQELCFLKLSSTPTPLRWSSFSTLTSGNNSNESD